MPKLLVTTPRKFIKFLLKSGFRLSHSRGSHQYFVKNTLFVCVPMHSRDIPKGTLVAMIKDIQMTKEEFLNQFKKI